MEIQVEIITIMAQITEYLDKVGYRVDAFEARENGLLETYFDIRMVKKK